MEEENTQLCANCKREIPAVNFTMHEMHCRRNIKLCQHCQEPVPHSDMEQHVQEEHMQVQCKCGVKMEKKQMEKHQLQCSLRLMKCQFCELEVPFSQLVEHEDYCGARTELCPKCQRNVMVKELDMHPLLCGTQQPEERNNARARPGPGERPPEVWFETHSIRNLLRTQELQNSNLPPGPRVPRPLEGRVHNSTRAVGASLRRNTAPRNRDQNIMDEEDIAERNRGRAGVDVPGGEASSLDYLLALSLQNNHRREPWTEGWGDPVSGMTGAAHLISGALTGLSGLIQPLVTELTHTPNNNISAGQSAVSDTMLPCEFCEELFPAEDLILHQTGCSPASAFASFSKRAPSPLQDDWPFRGGQGPLYRSYSPHSPPSPPSPPRHASSLSHSPPLQPQEGAVLIPCEFCGVTLEEDVVFHHQDKCGFRPGTAYPVEKPSARTALPPKVDNTQQSPPDLLRPRLRHQADPVPEALERVTVRPTALVAPAREKLGKATVGSRERWKPEPQDTFSSREAHSSTQIRRPQRSMEPGVRGVHPPCPEDHKRSFPQTGPTPSPGGRVDGRSNSRNSGTSKPRIPKVRNVEKEEE
ncbi:TRAF-type zinc finger domain-containing protein 1 isoform X2 [Amia ocellicauda]|uniref:TRAF-type zinc finger domain-containing protein 1 isoform X2 n=1 Tax=Amia ocellicauda TaxID=2972642 RepID=UPI0034639978